MSTQLGESVMQKKKAGSKTARRKDMTGATTVGRRWRKELGRRDSGLGVSLREAFDCGRLGKLTFEEAAEAVLSGRVSVEWLIDAHTDPDGFAAGEREAKQTLDKSLHAEWHQPHRNYVPDERPWTLAMAPTPRTVVTVSAGAAETPSCVELLERRGYTVVPESTDADCRVPAETYEDRNWSEALAAYKERVPNGSRSWHLRRSRNEEKTITQGVEGNDEQGSG